MVKTKLTVRWKGKLQALREVDKISYRIMGSRSDIYQDNWALMSLDSLLSGAMYKCDRARTTFDYQKKLDDVLDALNYLRFSAIRILQEIEHFHDGIHVEKEMLNNGK